MAKPIQFEQFHLTVLVPRGLRDDECELIRSVVDAAHFRGELRRAIRGVFRQHPALARARFAITRQRPGRRSQFVNCTDQRKERGERRWAPSKS